MIWRIIPESWQNRFSLKRPSIFYIFLYANLFIQFSTFMRLSDLWLKQLTYFFPIEEKNVIYSHSKSHFFVKTRLSRCSYSIVDLLCWSEHEIGRLFVCFFFLSKYIRSVRKKSLLTFVCTMQILVELVLNHWDQQKVDILRIPNW